MTKTTMTVTSLRTTNLPAEEGRGNWGSVPAAPGSDVTFDHSHLGLRANILSRDRYSKVEVNGCYAREPG